MQRYDYFLKRLLLIIPTYLGITMLCYAITLFVPGGPVEQALAKMRGTDARGGAKVTQVSEKQIQELRKKYELDKPIPVQYWHWLWRDRLGLTRTSIKNPNKTAWQMIQGRFKVSLIFGLTGFLLTYLVCIPLGIAKALRNGSTFDLGTSIVIFVGYATPAFAFGMILKLLFCGTVESFWDIFPIAGFVSDYYDTLSWWGKVQDVMSHMFLPLLCYMISSFALLTVLMKNSLLEEVGKDYIRTVLARGGSSRRAIWGHALRNSLIPIVTGIGGILTVMFAGAVLIEKVFEIPGMGLLSLDAIIGRDYPVFLGILSITTLLGLLGNILSDLCYVLIDPRINFEG